MVPILGTVPQNSPVVQGPNQPWPEVVGASRDIPPQLILHPSSLPQHSQTLPPPHGLLQEILLFPGMFLSKITLMGLRKRETRYKTSTPRSCCKAGVKLQDHPVRGRGHPGDGVGDSRTARGAQSSGTELPPPGSRRDAPHGDGLGCNGMGWDRGQEGEEHKEVPCPSLGLQGEGQLDTAELLPTIADDRPDAVVAIGHPGRQLHVGQDEVTGWQRVRALWREGICRKESAEPPRPTPKGTVVPSITPTGVLNIPL